MVEKARPADPEDRIYGEAMVARILEIEVSAGRLHSQLSQVRQRLANALGSQEDKGGFEVSFELACLVGVIGVGAVGVAKVNCSLTSWKSVYTRPACFIVTIFVRRAGTGGSSPPGRGTSYQGG